jgi:hypothetical protein
MTLPEAKRGRSLESNQCIPHFKSFWTEEQNVVIPMGFAEAGQGDASR